MDYSSLNKDDKLKMIVSLLLYYVIDSTEGLSYSGDNRSGCTCDRAMLDVAQKTGMPMSVVSQFIINMNIKLFGHECADRKRYKPGLTDKQLLKVLKYLVIELMRVN